MEKYTWTTTHNTAEGTMSHTFESGRIFVMVDWNTGTIYVQKDGKPLDTYKASDFTPEEYANMLGNLAAEDARLEQFGKID